MTRWQKAAGWFLGFWGLLALGYVLGPKPDYPPLSPAIPVLLTPLDSLEMTISREEAETRDLKQRRSSLCCKPDNEASIYWVDSTHRRTTWSIVYLHGFSASRGEADFMLTNVAKATGCNVYFSRLRGHGLADVDAFANVSPQDWVADAAKAIAIGKKLGERVILAGSSTGASLAIYLAAQNPDSVDALLLYSPNIRINNSMAWILNNPWGLHLAKALQGEPYRHIRHLKNTPAEAFWTTTYRLEGAVALQDLLEKTMQEQIFRAIRQPMMVAYYYRDETHKDEVVSIDAIRHFVEAVETPRPKKRVIALPDAGGHVFTSRFQNAEMLDEITGLTTDFIKEVVQE